jgi:predicted kinase
MPIIMLKGLPASGKSTHAKSLVAGGHRYVRINKDDLRAMCHGTYSAKREKQILKMRDAMIVAALQNDLIPIVDDTNLHPKHEARFREIAVTFNTDVQITEFEVDVEECIKRDLARTNSVGEDVIRKMYRDFIMPKPEPQDPALPQAIIVDVDGTLAIMGDRSPYADDKADIDTPNQPVIDIVNAALAKNPDLTLIVMSGRDEGRSRDVTLNWLRRHGIEPTLLLMRPAGDSRKDSIVKRELYETTIKGEYFVRFVLDDRDQVVRMWRDELGLTCLQVNWGNF